MLSLEPKFSKEIRDSINRRVSILDVIKMCGIKMVRSGGTWRSLCPFHDDKDTTSFTVIDNGNNFAHCFGCNNTWYPLNFYKDYERKTWKEAIEDIARAFNIDLTSYHREPTEEEKAISKAYKINIAVAEWLHEQVKYHAAPNRYLMSRYDLATMDKWKLGYCHQGAALMDYLYKKCKFEYQTLQKLDIRPSLFHDRITYPIFDMYGNIVGFSNRIWAPSKAEEEQKYKADKERGAFKKFINTGGNSVLFKHKSSNLQGLHFARKAVRKEKGTIIVVEGCSDVIVVQKHGFDNCVGSMSTAFNKHSIETLSSISVQHVIFCLDGDGAGQKRTLELLSSQKKLMSELPEESLKIRYSAVSIPDGLDPDEFLDKTPGGVEVFKKMIEKPMSLPEFYIHHYAKNNPEPKAITEKMHYIFNVRKNLMPLLSSAEVRIVSDTVREKFNITQNEFDEYNKALNLKKVIADPQKIEERILAWLVQDKKFRGTFMNTDFSPEMFSEGYSSLFRIIWQISNGKITTKEKALDEFNDSQLNIDLIVQCLKQMQLLQFFRTEARVRDMLLKPIGNTAGLLAEFKETVKKRKIKLLTSSLGTMIADYTTKELLDFMKKQIAMLERSK
jgi:DNA primase